MAVSSSNLNFLQYKYPGISELRSLNSQSIQRISGYQITFFQTSNISEPNHSNTSKLKYLNLQTLNTQTPIIQKPLAVAEILKRNSPNLENFTLLK